MEKMAVQKTLLREDKTAVVKCPQCRSVKTVSLKELARIKKDLRIRCSCGLKYPVELEFRNMCRKETNLRGTYFNYVHPKDKDMMLVKDVCMNGIGFTPLGQHKLILGDRIRVEFMLDDADTTVIKRDALVKLIKDKFIGCEFTGYDEYDKDLGNFTRS